MLIDHAVSGPVLWVRHCKSNSGRVHLIFEGYQGKADRGERPELDGNHEFRCTQTNVWKQEAADGRLTPRELVF